MKLHVHGVGMAFGLTWALGAFIVGLTALFWGYGLQIVELIGTVYIGFGPTFGGAVVGAIWGFVDAYIGGVIFAWLYNKFAR